MSLRSFTALAHSSRKRADLDLRPARIHSTSRSRSFAFRVVTHDSALTLCVSRQRCRRLPCAIHPLPAGLRRMEGATVRTTPACGLRIRRILVQTPSDGCFRRAPSLSDSPMSHSVTRSVQLPRPAALGVLLRTPCALRVWVSKEKISLRLRPKERARFFLRSLHRKHACGLGSGAHSRRFAQECPE